MLNFDREQQQKKMLSRLCGKYAGQSWMAESVTAFRHLPPNFARFGYSLHHWFSDCDWRGTLYLHAAVHSCQSNHVNMRHIHSGWEKKSCLNSNDFGFICTCVSNMVSYKTNIWYNPSCLSQTSCLLSIIRNLFRWMSFFRPTWCNQ